MGRSVPGSGPLKRLAGGVVGRRSSRVTWPLATVLAGAIVVATTFAVSGAVKREEQAARARAERYTNTVLFGAIDEGMVGEPILGRFYRRLLINVQAGIMTDERVARVRILSPDGTLLFSTGERDKIGGSVPVPEDLIRNAAAGTVGTVVGRATVAPRATIRGEVEELFQTFVPLRVQGRAAVVGVSQIDFLEDELRGAAVRPWRPVQATAGFALAVFALLTFAAFRFPPARPGAVAEVEYPPASEAIAPGEDAMAQADTATAPEHSRAEVEAAARAAEEELQAAREQLKQAEEAYRWLNSKARQSDDRARELEGQVQALQTRLDESAMEHAAAVEAQDAERTTEVAEAAALAEQRARAAEEELQRSEAMRAELAGERERADEELRALEQRMRLAEQRSDRAAALRSRLANARAREDDEPKAASSE